MEKLEKHELNFLPEANEDQFKEIKENIQNCGYDNLLPIVTYQGKVLDGWNRFLACKELDVSPKCIEFTGNDLDAIEFSIRVNLPRRHLSSSQRGALAAKAAEKYAAISEKVREEANKKRSENYKNQHSNNDSDQGHGSNDPRPSNNTNAKLAKTFGTSEGTIKRAKKLKKEAPEEFEEVLSGKKKLTAKKKTVKVERADPLKVEKFHKKEGNQPYHWGDGKKVLTTAYKQLKECKRVLSNIAFSAPYQFSKFLDGKYTGFMDDLQSWIELSETCPICQGTGHRESGGHELDCEHCGNTGKVGRT